MEGTERQSDPENEIDDEGTLDVGQTVGPYTLLCPIGRGGMARVWAASMPGGRGFAKTVALKTILPQYAGDEEYSRMFLDEAHVAAAVHHPNVCEVYQLGRDSRTLYMAMEWVVGCSLSDILRASGARVSLPFPVAARIIADACAGLHAAHEAKDEEGHPLHIVHRDASPHNILVSIDGHVKLADFGIAKARNQLHAKTRTGQFKGKITYVAPEQLANQTCDARVDVFAMGCVLYEATVGRQAFRGPSDVDTLRKIVRGEYARPRDLNREFPAALQDVIVQALETSPSRRYASAEAMRIALEEWLVKNYPIVSQEAVAAVVRDRVGPQIEARRAEVRSATRALRSSSSGPYSTNRAGISGENIVLPSLSSQGLARELAPNSESEPSIRNESQSMGSAGVSVSLNFTAVPRSRLGRLLAVLAALVFASLAGAIFLLLRR